MPPPAPVCGGCGDAYAEAATEAGLDLAVAESAATVRVHENGSATWTVRNRLNGPDADRVRGNGTLGERLAREASELGDGEFLGSATDGDAVVYRYRQADFASSGVGGAMVSDYLRQDLRVTNYDFLGADRVTVVAPPGMTVGRAPSEATVDGDRFTLTSVDQELVTFVPGGDLLAPAKSWLSVADRLSPVVSANVGILLIPALVAYVVVFGAVLFALGRLLSADAGRRARRVAVGVLAGTAAFAALSALYALVVETYLPAAAPAALVGAAVGLLVVAAGVRRRFESNEPPTDSGPGALSLAIAGVVAAAAMAGVAAPLLGARVVDAGSLVLMLTAPTFSLLPAGRWVARGQTLRAVGVVAAAFVASVFASPALYQSPQGVVFPHAPTGVVAAGVVAVLGAPLLVAGWSLAGLDAASRASADA